MPFIPYIDPKAIQAGAKNWKRYRDDTLDIEENWDSQKVKEFTQYLNESVLKDKIKFEEEPSGHELVFLDTKVHLIDGYLVLEIYSKPKDSHEYLYPDSAHPPMFPNGNSYAVALRVRRNCSDRFENDELFVRNLIQYKAHLMHSGYSPELIDKKIVKVAKLKRKDLLKTARKKIVQKGRQINFVTGYDPTFSDIRKAIRASEHILRADEKCNQVFPRGCFRVAYKKTHKNIKEMVAPSRIAIQEDSSNKHNSTFRNTQGKCSKCGRCGTATSGKKGQLTYTIAIVMLEGDRFRSTSTGAVYKIRQTIDCRSKNITYLVTCKRCRMQGVRSTLDFQGRVLDYITHIYKENDTCDIVEHFLKLEDHSLWNFSIMGIVQIETPLGTGRSLSKDSENLRAIGR